MKVPLQGAVDCDLHPAPPSVADLLPYLDEYWRDQIVDRHIARYSFNLTSYPPNSPLSARPDWRQASGAPGGTLDMIRRQALDPFGTRIAICNVLHGAAALFNEDMAMALCAAINDWVVKELLDREPRLRASILVPMHNPERAVTEINRLATDRRFVQVLLFAMGDTLLGRRPCWPIYAAAAKHGLAIGVHAGSTYRHAPMASGWPAHRVEDYVAQSAAFESQLLELPRRRRVPAIPDAAPGARESGYHLAAEPAVAHHQVVARHARRSALDRPVAGRDHPRARSRDACSQWTRRPAIGRFARTLEHIGSDRMLLFSTDYPHWHFEGDDVLPDGLSEEAVRRMLIDNPLETYPRLQRGGANRR